MDSTLHSIIITQHIQERIATALGERTAREVPRDGKDRPARRRAWRRRPARALDARASES